MKLNVFLLEALTSLQQQHQHDKQDALCLDVRFVAFFATSSSSNNNLTTKQISTLFDLCAILHGWLSHLTSCEVIHMMEYNDDDVQQQYHATSAYSVATSDQWRLNMFHHSITSCCEQLTRCCVGCYWLFSSFQA